MVRSCFQHLYALERKRIPPTPEEDLRLHRLERPEPLSEELLALMWETLPRNLENFYPDYQEFVQIVSRFTLWPEEGIVLGQGIESLVRDLIMLHCDPGDVVAFTHPTCAMFEVYADVFRARTHKIFIDPKIPTTISQIVAELPEETKLVILPNPGQPVDIYYTAMELLLLANRCAELGAVLAIDEAYLYFGTRSALAITKNFPNVVILRTFSKAFGGASLRVGFALGQPQTIIPLNACRQSGELAGPSMHAAKVMMLLWDSHVQPGIIDVINGRNFLRSSLEDMGYDVRGHHSNHVLIDMASVDMAKQTHQRLSRRGIHVRMNAAPLDSHLLVTCGSRPLMEKFLEAFIAVQSKEQVRVLS